MINENKVSGFIKENRLACGAVARYIDLVSEVGELGKELLKGSDYRRFPLRVTDAAREELGDCLFSLLALFEEMEVAPDAALEEALSKYRERLSRRGDVGSGR